jgi:16S rRNA (guanine527-N7)-methyltransferase
MSAHELCRARIERVLEAFHCPNVAVASGQLEQLLTLCQSWGGRVDLTAARDADELVDLYVADAAAIAAASSLRAGERWIDVGSGGGAPGLPLCILAPQIRLTLVEPRAKRVAFLRTALGILDRSDISVERVRSFALPEGRWDVAVSRATLPPNEWLREGARLAKSVWVLLARGEVPSLHGWQLDRTLSYRWPLTGVARRACRFIPESMQRPVSEPS